MKLAIVQHLACATQREIDHALAGRGVHGQAIDRRVFDRLSAETAGKSIRRDGACKTGMRGGEARRAAVTD